LGVADLPPYVPLLADVLGVCDGMVVNVEIKNSPADPGHDPSEAVAALTATAIAEAGWTERVLVSSFQVATLRAVQVADGRLPLGALWPFLTEAEGALALAAEAGFRAVHPFVTEVTPELVERAHAAGLAVNVWTVNGLEDLARLVALGVDAVITDRLCDALEIARDQSG
jgi:glycerophosphoryl diester phosphodiesterase